MADWPFRDRGCIPAGVRTGPGLRTGEDLADGRFPGAGLGHVLNELQNSSRTRTRLTTRCGWACTGCRSANSRCSASWAKSPGFDGQLVDI